jgi:hypothetical protein
MFPGPNNLFKEAVWLRIFKEAFLLEYFPASSNCWIFINQKKLRRLFVHIHGHDNDGKLNVTGVFDAGER